MIRLSLAAVQRAAALALVSTAALGSATAQDAPLRGPRHIDARWHALVGGTLVPEPGRRIEDATIVLRDGVIVSVTSGGPVPRGARVWDCDGKTIHAGFVEMHVGVETPKPDADRFGGHWHSNLALPERSVLDGSRLPDEEAESLRGAGFTAAAIAPNDGILRGTAAVVALGGDSTLMEAGTTEVLLDGVYQSLSFRTAGWGTDGVLGYPTSEMGAIALIRQAMFDVDHQAHSVEVARLAAVEPQVESTAIAALSDPDQLFLFHARNELQILRAARLANEFGRTLAALGTGTEFRRLGAVAGAGIPIAVPVAFPEAPDVSTAAAADAHSLRTLAGWEQAPTNPRRLVEAGVTIALTTDRLDDRGDFAAGVRKAIESGLDPEEALRALTIVPAELLGLGDRLGRVEPGMLAHLVVRDAGIFDEDSTIRDVWVGGRRFEVNAPEAPDHAGVYQFSLTAGGDIPALNGTLTIKGKKVTLVSGETQLEAMNVKLGPQHVHFHLDGEPLVGGGILSGSGLFENGRIHGTLTDASGVTAFWSAQHDAEATEAAEAEPDEVSEEGSGGEPVDGNAEGGSEEEASGNEKADSEKLPVQADNSAAGKEMAESEAQAESVDGSPSGDNSLGAEAKPAAPEANREIEADAGTGDRLPVPFGAYGRTELPEARTVVLRGATLWTSAEAGIVEGAVLVIENGVIRYVGPAEFAPSLEGAEELDVTGKHITPGLIDCHSHTGIGGGVNEGGRRVTSEVRIEDVIDPDDMSFYRQLAGGLTAANQLHGSANAIGGQNCVVKLRWGAEHPDDMRLDGAMPGIKFALGENPKRVAQGTDISDEYPQTRMGVEALIRDRLTAGREYREAMEHQEGLSEWERRRTMPVRRDLELEALGQIVAGERLIHCHSYRQDEILMLARMAQEFGFKLGTFQHVLEGYKVAEEVGESALGASTFADWWAYKFEVVDAIPHNASIMAEVGVNVSINSDSDEHARRLNTEAAKAVKYGGMSPAEALKLVTLNPAIQLGIDGRVGSLEVGKDADFAIWSADPLSYAARCEGTWVDGAELFSLREDAELRAHAEAERQRIIQKLLEESAEGNKKPKAGKGARGRRARPGSLAYDRDLEMMREELEALWRSGNDPGLSRPGVCGCFDVLFEAAAFRAQNR